jgi:predicted anti-sigma-YlaC factor YlaD
MRPRLQLSAMVLALVLWQTGCLTKFATGKLGDALSKSGTTFSSDDDPDLVGSALPFSLKLVESLLAENPRHRGLLFTAASGFTQYSYAYVQQPADEIEPDDLAAATKLRQRSRRLYLRARNYGLRGLEVSHKGFSEGLRTRLQETVAGTTKRDVPLLYWTAAAWGSVISLSKDDPETIADQPIVEALIDRALALDESFDEGAIHGFLISYEPSRLNGKGEPADRCKLHLDRAVQLSGGKLAAPWVSYVEAVSVQKQDRAEFESLLRRALEVNIEAKPESRLANLIAQRRARWLLERTPELFVE